ncbi:MAG: sensor histidine kinase [Aggregatilineales bacterium]
MTLPPFSYLLAGALSIADIGLLLWVITERRLAQNGLRPWLALTLLAALLAQAIHIVHPLASEGPYAGLFIVGLTQPAIAVYLAALLLAVAGGLTMRYLQRPGTILWLIVGVVWWVALIAIGFIVPNGAILGQPGWQGQAFQTPVDVPALVAIGGWAASGLMALLMAPLAARLAHLPEIANRARFWLLVVLLLWLGVALGVSGDETLKQVGWLAGWVGLIGALYGATTQRVLDVRQAARAVLGGTLLIGVTAIVILVVLLIAQRLAVPDEAVPLALIALAIGGAVVYVPVRALVQRIARRFSGGVIGIDDSAGITRRYSQEIAGVVELEELADAAMRAVRNALRVRRGSLILATRDDNDTLRVEPMRRQGDDMPDLKGWIPKSSRVYRMLAEERVTVLQFDLEFHTDYADTAPELRSFFKQLRMAAYAPIVTQGQVTGILAVGAKANDEPFNAHDLEILTTIASQTGVALRTARLVSDLRTASGEMRLLNRDLLQTKERLEKLDSVKTDFVTVASHELRTPLAQIRGYTDILETMNDQTLLNPDQVAGLTGNLRKATDRLERLIGDMLDVSQLDIHAMDLRFAPTTVENVLRLAIEPLTESIKQRKLTLMAHRLRGLPPIEADMQRLVQAFRNVVLNSIKFTPDGGQIEITGSLRKSPYTDKDEILISIRDTGIGVDLKNHELIFEKFFRVFDPGLHSTGATKFMGAGPGLGLTIARGVIEGHGGRIWVESPGYDPQKLPGSTFFVVLPISPPEDARRITAFETVPETTKAEVAKSV